jgi:S1/P1 Nuclease
VGATARTNFVHNTLYYCTQRGNATRKVAIGRAVPPPVWYLSTTMHGRNLRILFSAALLAAYQPAMSWSPGGHMVTGAMAYEELRATDPRVVEIIVELMAQHPDHGPFEVAANGATGEARVRRLFMEMARWPDDIRNGMYDHPTWHYASKPLIDSRTPPPALPRDATAGSAVEAFTLNVKIAGDPRAPAPERAIALCWILHLVGDIHQPLHAADGYSADYPHGDQGGGLRYVTGPQSLQPLSLHWYWDQAAIRTGDAAPARADELRTKLPREQFAELARRSNTADDFVAWAAESYALAHSQVYRGDLSTSPNEKQAPALSAAYVANSSAVAERRITLSGYRLADLLIAVLHE